MEKPDKSLFNYGSMSDSRVYRFTNLLGKEVEQYLSHDEVLVDVVCKICGNYFISGHGYMDSWFYCPGCYSNNRFATMEQHKEKLGKEHARNLKKLEDLVEIISKEAKTIEILEGKILKQKK